MSKQRKKTLNVSINPELRKMIDSIAKELNLSISEVTNRLLMLGFEYSNILNQQNTTKGEKKNVEC